MRIKRFLVSFLLIITLSTGFNLTAFASPQKVPSLNRAAYVIDVSNEIGLAFFIEEPAIQPFAYNSTSKTGTGYFYLKSNGDVLGNFSCTGTFNYDGSLCNVTDVSTSVSNTADGYKITRTGTKNQISPTYACATGDFSLYKVDSKGKQTLSTSAVINVYCNQKGTTTTEFNGGN